VLVVLVATLAPGCRGAPLLVPGPSDVARASALGAVPGGADGPGGFVPRGSARSFYAGAGGRLWYYLNNYWWVASETAGSPRDDELWIRAEVRADFRALERWPERTPLASPPTKLTVEYWRVGPGGRSVRLDNHKDYWQLDPKTCAGVVEVEVTLTLGRLRLVGARGELVPPEDAWVLEHADYGDERGVGAARTRFTALADRPTTVWGYRIPWSTWPSPLTRSAWQDLDLPAWRLCSVTEPPDAAPGATPPTGPVVTPGDSAPSPAPR
jgi:hypothetical protein